MPKTKRLASIREAAQYADVTERTIGRWRDAGRLTTHRSEVGGGPGRPSVRIDLDEIDRITRPVAS